VSAVPAAGSTADDACTSVAAVAANNIVERDRHSMPKRFVPLRLRPWTVVVAFALLLAALVPSTVLAQRGTSGAPGLHGQGSGSTRGAWLVHFRSDIDSNEAGQVVAEAGATELGELDELDTEVVSVPTHGGLNILWRLAKDPRVEKVEPDGVAQATLTPNDPHWDRAWGERKVRAPEAWNVSTGNSKTIIAIVDTGVDPRQPDLRGRVLRGWDFQNNDANPRDDNGHGTAVAGVASAAANDGVGIAGMCWNCRILPVKVLNANGSGSHSNIAAGIIYAVKHGADVINLSLAGPYPATVISDAVRFALRRGVVVVAAAGNEGSKRKSYPAAYDGVISVAATNGSDRLYSWSNRGSWVDLAAPGCAFTGKPRSSWSWWCGTSFATPMVAGTVALIKSVRPSMSRVAIERLLKQTSVGVRGISNGRINAGRALGRVAPAASPSP